MWRGMKKIPCYARLLTISMRYKNILKSCNPFINSAIRPLLLKITLIKSFAYYYQFDQTYNYKTHNMCKRISG